MYRGGLDRFKKAQSLEPFSVSLNASAKAASPPPPVLTFQHQISQSKPQVQTQNHASPRPAGPEAVVPVQLITQIGGGQSTWQPPDWAIEPRSGVYYLEVLKDGEVLDRINLDKRRHIFGRQHPACDFVLDHQSVSRQHAAVVPHRNGSTYDWIALRGRYRTDLSSRTEQPCGPDTEICLCQTCLPRRCSIYVIDLGSAHGTFVANERLTKEIPVELEVGQSLRFAASTRTYVLRKNAAALFPTATLPEEINLPSPPDPSDEEAVLAYNTLLNRYGLSKLDVLSKTNKDSGGTLNVSDGDHLSERPAKKSRKSRVAFKDQMGGELVQVVGISDGADVETEPGPVGVKEGSLVGKYESLVKITVIPKGKEQVVLKEEGFSPKGVTDKLQQVLDRVKSTPKGGIYDDLYGDSFSVKVGSSWAYSSGGEGARQTGLAEGSKGKPDITSSEKPTVGSEYDDDNDDLFGDS